MIQNIKDSLDRLIGYCETFDYKGFDPYDALKSPLFSLPFLQRSKVLRFGTQQLVKRLPFNIRPILFIPKGLNPVSIGLFIQGYAYLSRVNPEKGTYYKQKILVLSEQLEKMIPSGFSGACWGYDFDWEARHATIPAFQPTVVATGIITNALYVAWKITAIEKCANLVRSASNFILTDLNRTYDGNAFCFSYSPFDQQRVFNASMKGARLLSQSYAITQDNELKVLAGNAVDFVMKHQQSDGSWGYSLAASGDWIDNYHTGYVLDCLDDYMKLTGDDSKEENLFRGYGFYKNHFISEGRIPQFYSTKLYPVDCTAASQTILTLCRFGDVELAAEVTRWMIENMQAQNGGFYFRKYRYYTNKTSFMRWSNAWMFAALSFLNAKLNRP